MLLSRFNNSSKYFFYLEDFMTRKRVFFSFDYDNNDVMRVSQIKQMGFIEYGRTLLISMNGRK
jgi:hypothetical protein